MFYNKGVATVSVIVPSFNHARYLRACLNSVIAQTFTDWELFLLDDGSTDDSLAVAREAAADDRRIRAEANEKNLGTYGTQQECLDATGGKYVAVLNSDDLWQPDKLAKQLAVLETHPEASFCYTLGWKVDDRGLPDELEDVHDGWPTEPVQDLLPYLLKENRVLASSVLWRREGLRFDATCRYSGDHVALLEAAYRGPAVCVPERLAFWRMHGSNTFTLSEKQMMEEIRLREAILAHDADWKRARPGSDLVAEFTAANANNLFAVYALFGYRGRLASLAPAMLGHGPMRTRSIKRLLSTLLPRKVLRDHFWGHERAADTVAMDFRRQARDIRALPPIKFRLEQSRAARASLR